LKGGGEYSGKKSLCRGREFTLEEAGGCPIPKMKRRDGTGKQSSKQFQKEKNPIGEKSRREAPQESDETQVTSSWKNEKKAYEGQDWEKKEEGGGIEVDRRGGKGPQGRHPKGNEQLKAYTEVGSERWKKEGKWST